MTDSTKTQHVATASADKKAPRASRGVRPEIQALRAIAVATVVVFHYWPDAISGGYIGVDVFFAISEIRASTLYVENWNLAAAAVDYLGAENRPSPVQHYWSLSVEEQFYIVWPVLILIAMAAVRTASELVRRRAITVMLVVLTLASFIYSVIATANDPAAAFFITPTRVWEFGAGGLLALAATESSRPADTSYSIYLWHWPLLILAPFVLLRELDTPIKLALIALAVLLAGLTKMLVEDPLRSGPLLAGKRPRKTFIFALIATAIVLLSGFGALAVLEHRKVVDRQTTAKLLDGGVRCLGAAARDPEHQPCVNPELRYSASPSPATAREMSAPHDPTAANRSELCQGGLKIIGQLQLCTFGVPANEAKRQIVEIGDSHGRRWRPGLNVAALQSGWRVTSIVRRSCPFSSRRRGGATDRQGCDQWKPQLVKWMAANPQIDTLFEAQST
ncbi:MAG: acyltransferase family protein, partial [Solirubrobacterales bacterium]|nr:acyltransferase family protein [Solirubrobacterales bacterium]